MDEQIEKLRREVRANRDPLSIARLAAALNRLGQPSICELDGHYIIYNINVFNTQRTACWLKEIDLHQIPLHVSEQAELMAHLPRIQPNARHELPPIPVFFASIAAALQLRNDPDMGLLAQEFITFLWQHTQASHFFNTSTTFNLGENDTITHGSMLGIRQITRALRRSAQECLWEGTTPAATECDTLCYAITGMLPDQLRQVTAQFDNTKRADLQINLHADEPQATGSMHIVLIHAFGDAILSLNFQSQPEKQIKEGTTIPVTYL